MHRLPVDEYRPHADCRRRHVGERPVGVCLTRLRAPKRIELGVADPASACDVQPTRPARTDDRHPKRRVTGTEFEDVVLCSVAVVQEGVGHQCGERRTGHRGPERPLRGVNGVFGYGVGDVVTKISRPGIFSGPVGTAI